MAGFRCTGEPMSDFDRTTRADLLLMALHRFCLDNPERAEIDADDLSRIRPGFPVGFVAATMEQLLNLEFVRKIRIEDVGFGTATYVLTDRGLREAESLVAQAPSEATIILSDRVEAEVIPAADRFVTLDHNSAEYREAVTAIDNLVTAIETTNNQLFADKAQRLAVVREVKGIRTLLEDASVRISAIAQHVRDGGVLTWLVQKARDGVIGNYAYAAIEALRRLVGL